MSTEDPAVTAWQEAMDERVSARLAADEVFVASLVGVPVAGRARALLSFWKGVR